MGKLTRLVFLVAAMAVVAQAQFFGGGGGGVRKVAATPSQCKAGEIYLVTSTARYYLCTATDTLALVPTARTCIRTATGISDTLSTADLGCVVVYTASTEVSVTVPNGLGAGFNCLMVQGAAGQVRPVASAGVTLSNRQNYTKTAAQWSVMTILSHADNAFVLSGDMM